MDCLLAQQTLSAAVDREPTDPRLLAEARAHCENCPECSRFVRAQIAVAKAGLPEAPADLPDRVMAAIRAEAAEVQARADAERAAGTPVAAGIALATESSADTATAGTTTVPAAPDQVPAVLRTAPRPRMSPVAVIIAFAAVVLAGAVGVAMVGTRYMSSPSTSITTGGVASESAASLNSKAVPQSAQPGGGTDAAAPQPSTEAATVPDFIAMTGRVYRSQGPATVDPTTLRDAGVASISLTPGGTPTSHQLSTGTDPDVVYLTVQSNQLVGFKRVTRVFGGQTYHLTAANLTALGTWPTLPASISAPTSSDGYPTFISAGSDASGVRIYRLASSPASGGIAVPPGTPASDAAAGNPNWTFWDVGP